MWTYKEKIIEKIEELPENSIGYVYIITNLLNNRKYIGKKSLISIKTKLIKGKKKKIKTESDWKNYYGSNKELLEDVKKFGKENFKREILKCCSSKGEISYWEAKLQFNNTVLESDLYYNEWIFIRVRKSHLKNLSLDIS